MSEAPRILRQLRLQQFRNYASLRLDCFPGLNLLVGDNGQGKTNVLEAIHYLAFLRSFRTRQIAELIQWKTDGFAVAAQLAAGEEKSIDLEVHYGRERRLLAGRVAVDKASDFINQFLCVAFIPEDIELVKGSGVNRRRFLDMLAAQLDRSYLRVLHTFVETLKARNAMLRQFSRFDARSLAAFDDLLVKTGAAVVIRRQAMTQTLAEHCATLSQALLAGPPLELAFHPGFPLLAGGEPFPVEAAEVEQRLARALESNRERDERERVTAAGPQRDDLDITGDGRPLSAFGSEGQCRAAAIILRLGAAAVLQGNVGSTPGVVLLIDDILGELDRPRRQAFWNIVGNAPQTFFTCTQIPEELARSPAHAYEVVGGSLRPAT